MNKTLLLMSVAALGIFALVAISGVVLYGVGVVNNFNKIEVSADAIQKNNENILDNTRKQVREAGVVADKEVEALTNIITGYAGERGSGPDGGNNNMISIAAVNEAVPSITDVKTLQNLQNIVVAARNKWEAAQTRLIEKQRQGNEMLVTIPSSLILSLVGKEQFQITIVTSSETQENFASGTDDSSFLK